MSQPVQWQGRPGVDLVPLAGNRPMALTGDQALIVVEGAAHLFWQPDSQRRRTTFLARQTGQAFLELGAPGVILVGSPGTLIARMDRATFLAQPEALQLLEEWITRSGRALVDPMEDAHNLEPGKTLALKPQEEVSAQHALFLSCTRPLEVDGEVSGETLVVLPPLLRARATEPTSVEGLELKEALAHVALWPALERYHRWLLRRLSQRGARELQMHQARIEAMQASRLDNLGEGLLRLASALPGQAGMNTIVPHMGDTLFTAIELVAGAVGIPGLRSPSAERDVSDPLMRIAQASGFRVRLVKLPPDWWRTDAGPLLSSRDGKPVALLPDRPGRYKLVDPEDPRPVRVTRSVAEKLDSAAYVLYRPLPHDCVSFSGLVKFAWRDVRRDILIVLLVCILGAFMALATPVGLGWLTGTVIPSGQVTELWALGLGLGMATVVSSTASISQAITSLRIGSRVDANVQAAMTDRLLGLPAPFFRRYSSGDLTNRLLGFQSLVQAATGSILTAVLATMMSSTNLALMFYYDFWLAIIGLLLVGLLMGFLLFCSYLDLGLQRPLAQARGELSALVFQLIGAVGKIRVASAQARAFERWSRTFRERVRITYRSNLIQSNVNAVMPVYNTVSLTIFIGYLAHYHYKALSTSDFLALTAAYGAFVGAINTAAQSLTGILTTIPLAERFAPILSAVGEVANDHPNPGILEGRVEVSHVSFRYGPDEPLILKDVSLRAEPGEFVAVVGPSGSGKSTLLRQLLGFETPTQGRVLYDGQDLAGVNIPAVRRQLGVVLQNGQLMPGSILSNIIGSSLLTIDDAWHAAELAGIADDIRAMPMGMQTVVSEGGGAFSGGQKQRLLIARAVVARPRLILLDEATSALDSQTQEQVSRQLNELQATRIVIAHRLSTIEKADRIYVLKDGVVEQVGSFTELMAVPGPFRDLARRQLL